MAVGATAMAAVLALAPAVSASAGYYWEYLSFSCANKFKITSDTTGNVQHYRAGSLSAYWYGSSVRAIHSDSPSTPKSGSVASVETAGAYKWVYGASGACV